MGRTYAYQVTGTGRLVDHAGSVAVVLLRRSMPAYGSYDCAYTPGIDRIIILDGCAIVRDSVPLMSLVFSFWAKHPPDG